MKIALTGGIACGKSLVSRFLNELGVETIDADEIVHELLPDPAERKRIAAEVFADPEKRRALEAKLHPIVKARINAFLEGKADGSDKGQRTKDKGRGHLDMGTLEAQGSGTRTFKHSKIRKLSLAIIPLLFEAHWDAEYDIICCVTSSRAAQVERMMSTRGYSREEAEARLSAQLPVEAKAAKSHYVIVNDGSVEELKGKVAKFVLWLKEKLWQMNLTFSPAR